ncbi:hypothetical protein SAMN05216350_101539 [Polaromonas sp. YR568]|uniref:hypothetical protein n=1 Tax=Polaromonas sp. YR568 TaxID=1855301 RepID=UPI0008EEB921|nr:hypothetical protein [Polaromonas sp. YR568]SFU36472.1 hypothetical protein SAMN05216350_101539 [Polaromonas sp. YR568]
MSAAAQPVIASDQGQHDFDFLHGHWQVHNRRLRQRLLGSTDWESFDATQYCQPLLGGLGNTDELRHGAGPVGMSLRFFDLQARQWQIYWVDPRDGLLQPPVRGTFADGTGVFEGVDTHEGQPVRVRFTWSGTRSGTPQWEQAFSADEGKSWETNWVMSFTRLDAPPPAYEPLPSADHGFDFFFGRWKVRNRRLLTSPLNGNDWEVFEGRQTCEPLLGGLANYDELHDAQGVPLGLSIHLFDLAAGRWIARWVSARDGLLQPPVTGGFDKAGGVFEGTDAVNGQSVRLRYIWSCLDTPEPRWEQAHSADAGQTWTTNWVMDYSRAG